jgi:hypothetical protein
MQSKPKPATHYYFATCRQIEAEYWRRGKNMRLPSSFEVNHPLYIAIIDCIAQIQEESQTPTIRIPYAARVLYFQDGAA